jgi:hypothetical protein
MVTHFLSPMALMRTKRIVYFQNVSGDGDDICGATNELERGREIQNVRDESEGSIAIGPNERARIGLCWRARRSAGDPWTLRQRIKATVAAKLNIHEETSHRSESASTARCQ